VGAFIHSKETLLGVDEVFTIFTMLAIMIKPMHILVRARGSFQRGLEAFQKIQAFLLLEEFQISRTIEEPESAKDTTANNAFFNAALTDANVKFGDDKRVLDSLSVRFLKGNVYMVVGSPGCGKSTLLKTILGEVPLAQGNVIVTAKTIAYCSQSPWLQNLSIHENIVGHGQCDTEWYNTVLSGCELHQDLRELDDGDETLAGFGGRHLTISQRHRIVSTPAKV
jgi:ABC-type multidrug transport system fused ATPase/permease subunit